MERIKYRISLDMFEVASQTTIKAKKGDTACSIYITLMENGKIYQIEEGCHAVFSAKKPDGNFLFNSETCRIEDNTIIYDFTEQTTPIEGIVECEVVLKKGEDKLTSPRFNLKVDATVYNGEDIISTPEADALKELTDRAEDALKNLESIVPPIGTVDQIYNPESENAQSGKAVATAVTSLKVYSSDVEVPGDLIANLYVTTNGNTAATTDSSVTDYIPVESGFEILIADAYLENNRSICFYDANKKFLKAVTDYTEGNAVQMVVPDGACFVRITCRPNVKPIITKVNYPVNAEIKNINTKVERLDNRLSDEAISDKIVSYDMYQRSLEVGEMTEGKYIHTNGKVQDDAAGAVTDFIPVEAGFTLKITNAYLSGNRSICFYNADKTFLKLVANNTSATVIETSVPENACFIRVTSKLGETPEIIKIDYPINTELDKTNARIEEVCDELYDTIESGFERNLIPSAIYETSYVRKADGKIIKDTNENATVYVLPITAGDTVVLEGVYSKGTRGVCTYDSEMTLIEVLSAPDNSNPNTVSFIVAEGVSYVAVGSRNDFTFKAYVTNRFLRIDQRITDPLLQDVGSELRYSDDVGNFIGSEIAINKDDFVEGYLRSDGSSIYDTSSLYRTSPFVPVDELRNVVITKLFTASKTFVFFYATNTEGKNCLSAIRHTATTTVNSYTFTVPPNAKYIRFSILPKNLDLFTISYTKDAPKNYIPLTVTNSLYERTDGRLYNLLKSCTSKPIITFIDDDTADIKSVTRYHDCCEYAGIKGGYAVLTNRFELAQNNPNDGQSLANLLLQYEREGYHMVTHSYTQNEAYQVAKRDLAVCEDDLVHGLQDMHKFGFTDYKFWCTPYGVSDVDMQNLAKKWGMSCLVSSGNRDYNDNKVTYSRWQLRRISFEDADTDAYNSIETLHKAIDAAALDNGWVLVTTHMSGNAWVDEGDSTAMRDRFKSIVEYAKDKGFEVKTLNEAFRIREPLYRFYETL